MCATFLWETRFFPPFFAGFFFEILFDPTTFLDDLLAIDFLAAGFARAIRILRHGYSILKE